MVEQGFTRGIGEIKLIKAAQAAAAEAVETAAGAGAMSKALLPKDEAAIAAAGNADELDHGAMRRAVVDMLLEDRRAAYRNQQPAVAVSASVAIAKILGAMDGPVAADGPAFHVTISRHQHSP